MVITMPMAVAIIPNGFAFITALKICPAVEALLMAPVTPENILAIVEMKLNALNAAATPVITGISQLAFWMKNEMAELKIRNAVFPALMIFPNASAMVSLLFVIQVSSFVTRPKAASWICGIYCTKRSASWAFTPMSFSPIRSVVRPIRF